MSDPGTGLVMVYPWGGSSAATGCWVVIRILSRKACMVVNAREKTKGALSYLHEARLRRHGAFPFAVTTGVANED